MLGIISYRCDSIIETMSDNVIICVFSRLSSVADDIPLLYITILRFHHRRICKSIDAPPRGIVPRNYDKFEFNRKRNIASAIKEIYQPCFHSIVSLPQLALILFLTAAPRWLYSIKLAGLLNLYRARQEREPTKHEGSVISTYRFLRIICTWYISRMNDLICIIIYMCAFIILYISYTQNSLRHCSYNKGVQSWKRYLSREQLKQL